VLKKRKLRRIFGSKRERVAGGQRRLYSEELHNLYTLPIIIRVIKSMRMRWQEHVASIGDMRNAYKILSFKSEGEGLKT
jgi:hypothetical protein